MAFCGAGAHALWGWGMGHGAWGKRINLGIRASGHPQCPILNVLGYNRLNLLIPCRYLLA